LWSWGNNQYGMLGHNNTTNYSSPVQVPGNNWDYVVGTRGTRSKLGSKTDGTLWAWGDNDKGLLGQSESGPAQRSSPTQIPGSTWSTVIGSTSTTSFAATKTDGTLWAWGYNNVGQLGQNSRTDYSSPVQIGSDTTWPKTNQDHLSNANNGAHAIKTDGTLWCWGENDKGVLGQNSITYYSSPVQVPGTTWAGVKGKRMSKFGVKTDGTLWVWGGNSAGQLGLNDRTDYSSPVQVPGTTWSTATSSSNYGSSFGIKTDGTLWSWGQNYYGMLGQNAGEPARRSSPTQIPGTTWRSIAADWKAAVIATKTDGTIWGWGHNNVGQLGHNNTTNYSSPVQVPGTWNSSISMSYSSAMAFQTDTTP